MVQETIFKAPVTYKGLQRGEKAVERNVTGMDFPVDWDLLDQQQQQQKAKGARES